MDSSRKVVMPASSPTSASVRVMLLRVKYNRRTFGSRANSANTPGPKLIWFSISDKKRKAGNWHKGASCAAVSMSAERETPLRSSDHRRRSPLKRSRLARPICV
ncbi:hypothetical protein D3C77_648810 [compost metagenome]